LSCALLPPKNQAGYEKSGLGNLCKSHRPVIVI
jgi:hypothetical protein